MIDCDSRPFSDEVVDPFLIDISQTMIAAGSGMTEVMSHTGIFGIANTTLSFEVECLPGFAGESCVPVCSTDPCSNNGTCLQSVSGVTCACRGDFTGETCETRINDCQDVDCNDGTCVDGVLSFNCQCDPGFTGEFCERRITTAGMNINDVTTGSNSGKIGNSSNSSSNVGAVAGAVVGSIVVLVIAAAIVAIVLIVCIWKQKSSSIAAMQGIIILTHAAPGLLQLCCWCMRSVSCMG